jgi:hypothetical protein
MKQLLIAQFTAVFLLLALGVFGCKPKDTMPAPLPADQLPAAMQKAFASAPAPAKTAANEVVAAVEAKDYAKALTQLQQLAIMPKLSREQSSVTGRAVITVNELLQAAQAQGDQKAAQTLQNYRSLK